MSVDLYKDGEMVRCFCTKCGWSGEAAAPRFICGGCKRYMARPLDRDRRRVEAARVRCARLEEALATAVRVETERHKAYVKAVAISSGDWDDPPRETSWLSLASPCLTRHDPNQAP